MVSSVYYQRFDPFHRFLHILVMISFLGLAITGLPLKFHYTGWAVMLANLLGGFKSAGYLHRLCAIITFFYFFAHLFSVAAFLWKKKRGQILRFLFGPESPIPSFQDFKDMVNHIRWFLGKGPEPKWDFWTYWEKFDYWAVWWGVIIIGLSGLFLWFPMLFTRYLPGWLCNIAVIIHSDEALLAIGFIFSIHFFNTHLRPEKFPMDTVIFTGAITEEEMKEERSLLYERLKSQNTLDKLRIHAPLPEIVRLYKIFGLGALIIGISIIITVIWTEITIMFR